MNLLDIRDKRVRIRWVIAFQLGIVTGFQSGLNNIRMENKSISKGQIDTVSIWEVDDDNSTVDMQLEDGSHANKVDSGAFELA